MENLVIALYQRLMHRQPSETEIADGISALLKGGQDALHAQLAALPQAVQLQAITVPVVDLFQGSLPQMSAPDVVDHSSWSTIVPSSQVKIEAFVSDIIDLSKSAYEPSDDAGAIKDKVEELIDHIESLITDYLGGGSNSPTAEGTIEEQTAKEDEPFSLDVSGYFADADGDKLTYSAENLPEGLSIDPETGIISGELPQDQETKNVSVIVTASSGVEGESDATQTFDLHLIGVNDAPVLTGDLSARVGEAGSYTLTTEDLGYSDPDDADSAITFTVSEILHGAVTIDGESVQSFTYADLDAGKVSFVQDGTEGDEASFKVAVKDDDGATSAAETFKLDVTQLDLYFGNTKTSNNTGTVIEELKGTKDGTTGTIVGTMKASDGGSYSYEIEGSDKFDIENGVLKVKAGESLDYEVKSSYELTIKATDKADSSHVLTENVTVNVKDIDINPTTTSPDFVVKVTGKFNDLAGASYQRLFDFSKGANGDNSIWLGQDGKTGDLKIEFTGPATTGFGYGQTSVWHPSATLYNTIHEGQEQNWIAGFQTTRETVIHSLNPKTYSLETKTVTEGQLFVFEDKDNDGKYDASKDGQLALSNTFHYDPVVRGSEKVGESSYDQDKPLIGEVSHMEVFGAGYDLGSAFHHYYGF
ncbi:MAG: cadherin-like domain-containing protein [Pseudomonadota bacterium]|nr:cadherin-like domain-containing protein [Pseudomonadota bacterium]